VFANLARYTHRIAISNAHILAPDDDQVRLSYRDYRDGQSNTQQLQASELIRRFLLHGLRALSLTGRRRQAPTPRAQR